MTPPKKQKGPARVAEALSQYLDRSGLGDRIEEAAVVPEWAGLVGEAIAAATTPMAVNNGTLFVTVRSSAWLMELKLMEQEILRLLNRGRTKGRIEKIRFFMAEWPAPKTGRRTGRSRETRGRSGVSFRIEKFQFLRVVQWRRTSPRRTNTAPVRSRF